MSAFPFGHSGVAADEESGLQPEAGIDVGDSRDKKGERKGQKRDRTTNSFLEEDF